MKCLNCLTSWLSTNHKFGRKLKFKFEHICEWHVFLSSFSHHFHRIFCFPSSMNYLFKINLFLSTIMDTYLDCSCYYQLDKNTWSVYWNILLCLHSSIIICVFFLKLRSKAKSMWSKLANAAHWVLNNNNASICLNIAMIYHVIRY